MKNTIRLSAVLLATTVLPVAAQSDVRMGERLYQENCASCHGANHHPDRVLFDIVKRGPAAIVGNGYESDMPGYEDVLTDDEITAIIDYIKSTWPNRIRASQESRSLADEQAQP